METGLALQNVTMQPAKCTAGVKRPSGVTSFCCQQVTRKIINHDNGTSTILFQ